MSPSKAQQARSMFTRGFHLVAIAQALNVTLLAVALAVHREATSG